MTFPGSKLFYEHDTKGFPAEVASMILAGKGIEIEWASFVEAAAKAGWKYDRVLDIFTKCIEYYNYDPTLVKLLDYCITSYYIELVE